MKRFLMLCWAILPFCSNAQETSGQEITPFYNFKKGIGITTPDSLFQVNLRFRMQSRAGVFFEQDKPTEYEMQVRRLRLRLEGFVKDPKLTYTIQLSFTPGDTGSNPSNFIRDAVIHYKPNPHWAFHFGQTKLPGNRQRVNSSGALQFTDRTINNASFTIDRDFGLFAYYSNQFSEDFNFSIKTAVSTGEGRNFSRKSEGLSYTGRVELYPLGKFSKNGAFFEGDLERETSPKLYFGAGYNFNNKAIKSQGQTGENLFEARDLHTFSSDLVFKYSGLASMLSYMRRDAANPITRKGAEEASVFVGQGIDVQNSYTFASMWEISSRYSFQKPLGAISHLYAKKNEFSLGVTKYIWGHSLKFQTELTHSIHHFHNNVSKKQWYGRFQVEFGI